GAGRRAPDAWLAAWVGAGAAAAAALDSVLDAEPAMCGPAVARAVAASVGPGRLLFAGSSSSIRDLDLAGGPPGHQGDHPAGQVTVLANRGLSGIDGAVSTAIGAALAHGGNEDRASVALLGDLAFLHDATGLVIGPDEPRPDLTIVVVNDDGGGLFQLLEQGAPEHAPAFERVFGTPHGVDLAALCAATGTPYALAGTDDELTALLERPGDGICVIEVPITRTDRRALHERIRTAVAAAVDALAGSTS
nr:2-succinyl-5-enolpyruvyl-6-hydroxy-3-cyclohexene-1-carboxylic-acid synthase [Sporichthyaceae bacterium]